MDVTQLKDKINNLSIWKKGDQRAPHKPLLILYALSRFNAGKDRFIPYKEVREVLSNLLIDFGPKRKSYHPEEPFVRLQRDGIWELNIEVDRSNPSNKLLLENGVSGGFTEEVINALKDNPGLVYEIANIVLENHFPETLHDDILRQVGLDLVYQGKRQRDPRFREKILRAYEYSCAVCGFNVRLGNNLVGVEAAHIKWHQAGGPDTEENGIALCSMHHKLFDRGVFTLTDSRILLVSEEANGTNGFEEWLMRFHGQTIRTPIHPAYRPEISYVNWHVREVFRGRERYYSN
ncbi:phosphorothioated DNA-binding restriction endonuclease [Bacillus litorisediminis]|uniref:phosphorothioated DNA-binding restriction endonuclease n=1 Tax=Bacillus litorisediminis TaxID=2922713 RepID=UPI001FB02B78|nr:HNH endonuclease [Bacillus litorisediminis]